MINLIFYLPDDTPINPINPYGRTKVVAGKKFLMIFIYLLHLTGRSLILGTLNPIGAHESGMIGEDSKSESTQYFPFNK